MLRVKVLRADGSEELFFASTVEVQHGVISFDTPSGLRAFEQSEEQHIEVKFGEPALLRKPTDWEKCIGPCWHNACKE